MRTRLTLSIWPRVELTGVDESVMHEALNLLAKRSGMTETVVFRWSGLASLPGSTLPLLEKYGLPINPTNYPEDGGFTDQSVEVKSNTLVPLVQNLWRDHIGFEGFTKPKSNNYYTAVNIVGMILETFEIYW